MQQRGRQQELSALCRVLLLARHLPCESVSLAPAGDESVEKDLAKTLNKPAGLLPYRLLFLVDLR